MTPGNPRQRGLVPDNRRVPSEKKRDSPVKRKTQVWLTAEQKRAWYAYMRVQLRMNYEMNRQLQADSGLSLSDYDVLNALSSSRENTMRVGDLAAEIGWERSRLSHQLRRMEARGLTGRKPNKDDRRATDVILTEAGLAAIVAAAPAHVDLVRRLFFDALPENLLGPLTAAFEHIYVSLNLNASIPPARS
ncbi:MarR family winged helix-turn-helix transcriptional regulator [Mycobacterium sp. 236(2023)]|uniref:MarR family winged helix-turn-helix transcriptional regulator n=1 Tax=Mycobacterium sp. 236(2023) TaxID=3038163 RepID=UPI0024153C5E|nr:MarR family winged helix-turn-helix transcriptional regulator [Mycobacterium sp. 236(2023)]MDG4667263.1 MarR family winged helix-turn-helix transcriptional regulator [Mycobacterium sp. 236(2023)]